MQIAGLIDKLSVLMQLHKVAAESKTKKQYPEREILLLELIKTNKKINMSEISEKYKVVGKSIVSTTISEFWKDGLVEKTKEYGNQRNTYVVLTEKGEKLLNTIRKKKAERFKFLMNALALNNEEEEVIKRVLERAIKTFDERLTHKL